MANLTNSTHWLCIAFLSITSAYSRRMAFRKCATNHHWCVLVCGDISFSLILRIYQCQHMTGSVSWTETRWNFALYECYTRAHPKGTRHDRFSWIYNEIVRRNWFATKCHWTDTIWSHPSLLPMRGAMLEMIFCSRSTLQPSPSRHTAQPMCPHFFFFTIAISKSNKTWCFPFFISQIMRCQECILKEKEKLFCTVVNSKKELVNKIKLDRSAWIVNHFWLAEMDIYK